MARRVKQQGWIVEEFSDTLTVVIANPTVARYHSIITFGDVSESNAIVDERSDYYCERFLCWWNVDFVQDSGALAQGIYTVAFGTLETIETFNQNLDQAGAMSVGTTESFSRILHQGVYNSWNTKGIKTDSGGAVETANPNGGLVQYPVPQRIESFDYQGRFALREEQELGVVWASEFPFDGDVFALNVWTKSLWRKRRA